MSNLSPFWEKLTENPRQLPRLGFTDITDVRVQDATGYLKEKKLANPVLVEPVSSAERANLKALLLTRQEKLKLSETHIDQQLEDPLYHAIGLLLENKIDGLISGSLRPTADIVRAAIQCIGPRPGVRLVSGQFFIETEAISSFDKTPFLFSDCAVMPEPSARALASIAISAAESFRFFTGQIPKVAFLSFSTRGSAQHPLVDRIKESLEITRKLDANLVVDGEIQLDAALDTNVAAIKKASDSPIAGKANVFIFPTLEAGNIGYKLVQRFGTARIAGPLLWGLAKPVSDLSRGCTVQEIIDSALCVSRMVRGQK